MNTGTSYNPRCPALHIALSEHTSPKDVCWFTLNPRLVVLWHRRTTQTPTKVLAQYIYDDMITDRV